MISNKLVKEVHGLELQWKVGCLSRTYSAVVLADKKEGISVKPYWKDKKERQEFISEWEKLTGSTRKEVVEMVEAPTFCFAHYSINAYEEEIRIDIANKGPVDVDILLNVSPICPFA
jgi:hypothetical protein